MPRHQAAWRGHTEVGAALLAAAAPIDAVGADGRTSLLEAASMGTPAMGRKAAGGRSVAKHGRR